MKIAILTSGILPVPAMQGGAVENLVDFYLAYNDHHRLHDITVYSVWHPDVEHHPALRSVVNHYRYIKVEGMVAKMRKRLLHWRNNGVEYYHYTIEYFLHEALKDIRRQHYDLVILENRPGYTVNINRSLLVKGDSQSPLPLVLHLHNDLLNSQTARYQDIYAAATRIITVSDFIKSRVLTINPADTKTLTVRNGIDVEAFARATAANRHALGLRDDDFVLVFCGRMTKEKGILQLIEAMHMISGLAQGLPLQKDERQPRLLVIGSSFYANAQGDDPFTLLLKEKAGQLGDHIIFTGFIPYAQMPAYLKMADVAVLPSVWDEPLGLTCIEAMACGLPLITTCQGGIPETVTPDCAMLLKADGHLSQSLADAILTLYRDPQRRALMAEATKSRSLLFDKEAFARQFFAALDGMS